jgi:hypothetical protein
MVTISITSRHASDAPEELHGQGPPGRRGRLSDHARSILIDKLAAIRGRGETSAPLSRAGSFLCMVGDMRERLCTSGAARLRSLLTALLLAVAASAVVGACRAETIGGALAKAYRTHDLDRAPSAQQAHCQARAGRELQRRHPTAGHTGGGGRRNRHKALLGYSDNYLIDLKQAVIVDVEATTAIRQAEVGAAKTMLDRTAEQFDLALSRLVTDASYGSAEMLGWATDQLAQRIALAD